MPLTTLDTVAALVVIDVQKGIMGMLAEDVRAEVVGRSAALAKAFRKRGLPVVLVTVTGGAPGRTDLQRSKQAFPADFTELMTELEQQDGDVVVMKQRVGAFLGTRLDETLRERGVTQIFFTGVATSNGVEASARSAYDLGYNVVFVGDAMADRNAEAHAWSLGKIFPKLGEIETTESVLGVLAW